MRFSDEVLARFYQRFVDHVESEDLYRQQDTAEKHARRQLELAEKQELQAELKAMRQVISGNDKGLREVADTLRKAFPAGDVHAHRAYHEAQILAQAEQAKFWRDLRLDLAKKGLWAVLLVLMGFVVTGFVHWIKGQTGVGP